MAVSLSSWHIKTERAKETTLTAGKGAVLKLEFVGGAGGHKVAPHCQAIAREEKLCLLAQPQMLGEARKELQPPRLTLFYLEGERFLHPLARVLLQAGVHVHLQQQTGPCVNDRK